MPCKIFFLISALVLFFGLSVVCDPGIAGDQGPQTLELKTFSGKKPARFPHRRHQKKFACKECHHTKTDTGLKEEYSDDMKIERCVACHNENDMTNPKLNSFKLAAHGLCKACHKQNRDSAPTKCSGCHIK